MRLQHVGLRAGLVAPVGFFLVCVLLPATALAHGFDVASSFGEGVIKASRDPGQSPSGVNLGDCTPAEGKPNPVVLIPGTFANMQDDYGALGPILANAGYCVYSLNYGAPPGRFIQAIGPLASSGQEVAEFVNQVLIRTGVQKVDLVGHSQGGTLIEYYAKILNGAASVDKLVALAPTTHGTTLSGLSQLARAIPSANAIIGGLCPACADQQKGSPFIATLNDGPVAVAGVTYTVIATRFDLVATPAGKASFINESGVVNRYVQDVCPFDFVDHVNITYDHVAIRLIRNALTPATARYPNCFRAFPVRPR